MLNFKNALIVKFSDYNNETIDIREIFHLMTQQMPKKR